jgi:hypothetical protein
VLAQTTTRKAIRPPSGFEDHLCRRDAAALLGFASEFKVRQLEKEGRLRPIRGAMGSAWYPRQEIEALRATSARPSSPAAPGLRWPDDALIALLREKPRTVVDLVVDAGISIARAERVYRFWQAHEGAAATAAAGEAPGGRVAGAVGATRTTPPTLTPARATPLAPPPAPPARATALPPTPAPPSRATPPSPPSPAPAPAPAPAASVAPADEAAERRSGERLEHDALVRQLRDADPKVRAAAFDKLKSQRR